jgi:3-hydroxymyristoyl/3-hydroxydecanoyl-(acyl carrier protein) dehydratase
LEALALPRRWRFVRHLPESAQGKTTVESLEALFRPTCGRCTELDVTDSVVGMERAVIEMTLEPGLVYFDGHFEAAAILPGVVQVDWAIEQGRKRFPIQGSFQRIEALKFFQVIRAGARVSIELEFDPEKGRLAFCYRGDGVTHSSGRIKFEARS